MPATIERLGAQHHDALRSFLTRDVKQHLYLLGLLEDFGVEGGDPDAPHAFWGRLERGELTAVLFVGGDGGLVVPSQGDPSHFHELTAPLAETVVLRACVGERGPVDAVVRALGRGKKPRLSVPQRLFTVSADDMGPFTNPLLRLATEADIPRLVELSAEDLLERYGQNPLEMDPEALTQRVRHRVRDARSYVLEEEGELVFKIDIGSRSQWGAELEGLHTHRHHRRKGHALLNLGQISRHLLSSLPRLSLRVSEQDEVTAKIARRVGYVAGATQRLVLMGNGPVR